MLCKLNHFYLFIKCKIQVSLERIGNFLLLEETDSDAVEKKPDSGNFLWK
jgi:hypothetical protein